ncbi:MAG: rhomboid family intramembrane serine protease [Erysipelotrichaceae bacterium]|nr:rhomboid family intramembrane serine protease [Erysipelotrichaceae bacterium]
MRYHICTVVLIFINVIVFMAIRAGRLDPDDLGMSYHLVFNRKEYRRILTSAFTHVDPMHLLMNMVSLYNVGSFVESYFGRGRMLVIYFVSLILGKLLSMYIRHSNHDDYTVSIGASGAISGLLGAYFLVILHYYGFGGISYLSRPLISLVMISIMPGVDGTSHFSCMAAGMAVTWLFFLF